MGYLDIPFAEANRDKESMVFDWNKAAQLIKDRGVEYASAGLAVQLLG